MSEEYASVRYIVDDVDAAIEFYTEHLGFTVLSHPAPPFADVVRGHLRVLLSGPPSSGARATPSEESGPGRNRIHLEVDDLDEHLDRLKAAGVTLRSDVVEGPGGRQFLVADPAGNLVEIFEPAG
jgi:catechol 2,3-dioxygenase-like lactoylglutathione lyase family enzyme